MSESLVPGPGHLTSDPGRVGQFKGIVAAVRGRSHAGQGLTARDLSLERQEQGRAVKSKGRNWRDRGIEPGFTRFKDWEG